MKNKDCKVTFLQGDPISTSMLCISWVGSEVTGIPATLIFPSLKPKEKGSVAGKLSKPNSSFKSVCEDVNNPPRKPQEA